MVTPAEPDFAAPVHEIRSLPDPFGRSPDGFDYGAVLRNPSGRAIVVFSYFWRYATAPGGKRLSRCANLGSSLLSDYLSGRTGVPRGLGSFIRPGSKRRITEDGMFGNNLDVLPPEAVGCGGGIGRDREEMMEIELMLDLAVLEDGLCVGPGEFGLSDNLVADLHKQRGKAREIAGS